MSGDVVIGPPLTRFGRGGGRLGPPVGLLPAAGAQALAFADQVVQGSAMVGEGVAQLGQGGEEAVQVLDGDRQRVAVGLVDDARRQPIRGGSGMLGPAAVGVVAGAGGGESVLCSAHLALRLVDGVGWRQGGRQPLERVAAVGGNHGPGCGLGDDCPVLGDLGPQLVEQAFTGCLPGARPEELDCVLAPGAARNSERPSTADADPGGDAGLVVDSDRPQ